MRYISLFKNTKFTFINYMGFSKFDYNFNRTKIQLVINILYAFQRNTLIINSFWVFAYTSR